MDIITNYNNSSSVAEANATTTYNEIKAYSEEQRRIAIAILKGKMADYEIYNDLITLLGWVVTIVASSAINNLKSAIGVACTIAALWGIWCLVCKEKIRVIKSLLAIIEQTME
ncbi:hypothetical protein [Pseudobutyrivibrio sp.]|uniref:hypothetical protein n=1 Tax=Pseudobutyrivibrio sp. TaxID=2014367 RepID=UPI001DCCCF75|nr:hypothetical protein [Pseudobutyrivibrio sp.]MBE5911681.1 hypothetical protein [Pseudobutyrivibrio sp.]